ncbi:MAG TPA: dTMP kinase [Polyangiaceae bacterium]|nr:dTMP kinase [Polyangiaceae bacterium]
MARDHDGRFIVFEGIDGAGTTTQSERYAAFLRGERRVVHVTHQPSDGPIGSMLRLGLGGRLQLGASNQAQCMALLFAADRLDHVAHQIEPHLRDGAVVICDRYDLSSIAYQTATARTEDREAFEIWVRELNRYAPRPDATVVLDVTPEEAERRRQERLGALELYEETALQRELAALYARAESLVPGDHVIRVDGNRPLDEVTEAVQRALADVVG